MNKVLRPVLLGLIVLFSRWFFLNAGYGAEEDAWGYALNAMQMEQSHTYSYSRLPGHPVLEWTYYLLPSKVALAFNLLTALVSIIAVVYFFLICRKYKVNATIGALMLAFTPVFYIQSTTAMDYNWALCFILASFYYLGKRHYFVSAVMIALAAGCRLTSLTLVVPFALYLYATTKNYRHILSYLFIISIGTVLIFLPLIVNYGTSFLTYVNQFGYPPVIKSVYKATIAVWGTIGFIAIASAVIAAVIKFMKKSYNTAYSHVLKTCSFSVFVTVILYSYEPHKSAYLIPAIPFVLLFILITLRKQLLQMGILIALITGCFFLGINLADKNRSALPGKWAYVTTVGPNQVAFDPLSGIVVDDYKKRLQRISYVNTILDKVSHYKYQTAIISGYWLNMILVLKEGRSYDHITWLHYADQSTLQQLTDQGSQIYFISGQEVFNDRCFGKTFTKNMAQELPL
jgi:hypothetical protein